mgnify:CR=1 FL=1
MAISKTGAKWLVEEFNPIRKGTINKQTIGTFIQAINILLGQNRRIPGCACEYKVIAAIANSAYEQHEQEILKLYESIQ